MSVITLPNVFSRKDSIGIFYIGSEIELLTRQRKHKLKCRFTCILMQVDSTMLQSTALKIKKRLREYNSLLYKQRYIFILS